MLETGIQVAALGAFIWAAGFQLPRARRDGDVLAVTCSILTALLALGLFLFGVGRHAP